MLFYLNRVIIRKDSISGYSGAGTAPHLGCGDRAFESHYSDHCRQSLRLTIVIRRFCLCLVRLHQNRSLELAITTYRRYQQADLRRWVSLKPAFVYVLESEATMKLPYGYVLAGDEIVVHEEKADVVRSIFEYYLAGASLGKIVDMLFAKGISSPTGNPKWTRAAVNKLLANKKYVPIVGVKVYLDAQFEKERRCNVDYDRVGKPRKAVRYQSPSLYMK